MEHPPHVCMVCGYNMPGDRPDRCPFCGADPGHFLTTDEAAARYRVELEPIGARLWRLAVVPAMGLEHWAYRLDTGAKVFLIDCPAVFDPALPPAEVIAFTHPHFLGAGHLYRRAFGAETWIHVADAADPLAKEHPFDRVFERGFAEAGLEVHPIGGHTPGYTVYLHADRLFPGDLVFSGPGGLRFNPYGPERSTREAGAALLSWLEDRPLARVCGWNYLADYGEWRERLRGLLAADGPRG